jgi:hypothetical protein
METLTFQFFGQLVVLAFLVACLEMAFQYFMMPNMILYPYAVLLAHFARKNGAFRHLARPLGRCKYCNSIWIGFYVFYYFFGYSITVLLLFGLIFLFVRLLSDYVFQNVDGIMVDSVYGFEYPKDSTWQDMMKAYVVLGIFYTFMYLIFPNIPLML